MNNIDLHAQCRRETEAVYDYLFKSLKVVKVIRQVEGVGVVLNITSIVTTPQGTTVYV